MPEHFRSFASMLIGLPAMPTPQEDEPPSAPPDCGVLDAAQSDLVRDVRLFHARIAEAVDCAVDVLLADIAADVLARELQLAPADLQRIVERALARHLAEEPLRVRVSPEDASSLACEVPVIADEGLRRGDVLVELRDGMLDATLGVRLAAVAAYGAA